MEGWLCLTASNCEAKQGKDAWGPGVYVLVDQWAGVQGAF